MGASNSKSASGASQHIFASETPVSFSHDLVKSLQANVETDSSREKTLELHIQSRVAEELRRIDAHESQVLKQIQDQLFAAEDRQAGGGDRSSGDKLRDLGREGVQKEIATLKEKLAGRKKLEAPNKEVEKAREDVVQCLRLNDRRPLDCWKELEAFKKEVGRLEKGFVDKALQ